MNGAAFHSFAGLLAALTLCLSDAVGATLVVATYNVQNYTVTDRRADGRYRPDYPKPEREKAAQRQVIHGLGADVLALQEMGGSGFLEELRLDLKAEGLDYPYAQVLQAADEARCLAVLSKRPFAEIVGHDDLTLKYFGETVPVRRGLLEVAIEEDGRRLTLFVVHFKSRLTERADDESAAIQRAAEAVAVRDRVLERCPDPAADAFLVVGDFNDLRPNRPLRAVLDRGNTRISEWVPATDSRGETWTHYYAREEVYSRVDHILASPAARAWVKRSWIADSAEVGRASDHRPVVVELEW